MTMGAGVKRFLGVAAVLLVVLVAVFAVLVQQDNAWTSADLDRNVQEFNSTNTLDECMAEIDGVWLPWLRAEARDMCTEAINRD